MDVAKSNSSDTTIELLEGGIRALVRGNRPADAAVSSTEDALAAGATSVADIEKLMEEVKSRATTCSPKESACVRRTLAMPSLAHKASASVKIIAESLGKWRTLESGQVPAALPRAPS